MNGQQEKSNYVITGTNSTLSPSHSVMKVGDRYNDYYLRKSLQLLELGTSSQSLDSF